MVLDVVTQLLGIDGHDVKPFRSGDAALVWLGTTDEPLDILITDLGLPERSGWEVAAAARQLRP